MSYVVTLFIQQNLQLQEAYWNPNIYQLIASSSFLLKALGSHFMKFLQRHAPCRFERQCFVEMRRDDCQPNAGTHGTHLGQLRSDTLMPPSIAANVDKQNGQIMIYIYIYWTIVIVCFLIKCRFSGRLLASSAVPIRPCDFPGFSERIIIRDFGFVHPPDLG